MTDLTLIKRHGLLLPSSELDEEIINSMQDGCLYKVKISKVRNPQFHRKYFALLDVLYNFFTPQITPLANGMVPKKSRCRFRKDLIIATGNYDLVVNIKNDVRAEAKSISFSAMDEVEFTQLYNKTINYGIQHIAVGKNRAEIDEWVDQIMSFT